jgi:TolB-like protein/Flp pilus assembly protein TadD
MFTDMVGYTALGQRSESLSLALVEEQRKIIRQILARHNGREVKTIGDAFLVEFPNAVDAVRCAYDIQRVVKEFDLSMAPEKRIHLRIGVHVGEIVAAADGDISGDAVNVASRIEPLAEDGGVCISRQVHDHVQNKLEFRFAGLGPKPLKNVSIPIEVFKMEMPWSDHQSTAPLQLDKRRIAVLPFANLSSDPSDEYFSDGMTEELITSLAGVNGLSVIARTSVMKYKGAPKGASEVAKELSAGSLIEGSVRKAGNRVRITVQLIDGATESHSWAQNYDKDLTDVFAIQSDVAKQVAQVLQVKLLSAEKRMLEKAPTSNIEAYTLYLKGIHHLRSFEGSSGQERAATHFEEAVANDPSFALAYAYLAYTYNQMGFYGMMPSDEAGRKAKHFASKALELDDTLAEAHHAMGRVMRNYDWDFAGAAREFRRAIELRPSYAEAYGALAILLMFDWQLEEAMAAIRKVLELDPISPIGTSYAGTFYLYSGRNDEAIEMFTKALESNPTSAYDKGNLGLAHIRKGMFEEGIREFEGVAEMKAPASMNDLAYAYARAGMTDKLKDLLGKLLEEVKTRPELAVAVGGAYANLGDADRAMEWLEKAYEMHLAYLPSINSDFSFDAIRLDPRFQSMMRKIGFKNTEGPKQTP